jgi:hypothetical protein
MSRQSADLVFWDTLIKEAKLPLQKKDSEAKRENRGKSAPIYEKDRPKGQICPRA